MSELLSLNWNTESFNKILQKSSLELLNHEFLEKGYLLKLIDKVYDYESKHDLKDAIPFRVWILIEVFAYKIMKGDIKDIEESVGSLSTEKIPLASTCLLFAIEQESYQINYKKTDDEKAKFHDTLKDLLGTCKMLIRKYKPNLFWGSFCTILSNSHIEEKTYSDFRYEVINFRVNLMFAYKRIESIESDYISVLATGRTWEETHEFFNQLNDIEIR